jgi:hypothetical protein
MTDLRYVAHVDDRGWGVFEPVTGHRCDFYGEDLDGEQAETLARAHAEERTHELNFMAGYLGVTPRVFIDALKATRDRIDHLISVGAL